MTKNVAAAIKDWGDKVSLYAAEVDVSSHAIDALTYALDATNARTELWDRQPPPPTPPGLTPEQHAAHLALHGLVSVEEFEKLRKRVGFVLLTPYWGAIGNDRFCCEKPLAVQLDEAWRAQIETPEHPKSRTWDHVRKWLGLGD